MEDDYGYECYERDDDYNVFEENCLDADRAAGEYEDRPGDEEPYDEDEADSYAFEDEPEDAWLDGSYETE